MVIAQLTHLWIAIPSSGNPPGEVPSDCFPTTTETSVSKKPRRVTFSLVIQSTAGEMADWDDIGDATLDPGFCGELVSTNNGREVVSTASHTALTDHSGGLPGFYCGGSGFSGVGIIHTGRTRPG